MMDVLVTILAYLLGSVPTGVVVSRIAGVDVRSVGSGNVGATNVSRAAGRGAGLLTLFCDIGKGLAAVALAGWLGTTSISRQLAAVAALLGHAFPVFLRFSGGKGVATGFGVCLALVPQAMILPVVLFAVTFGATRIVSVASIVGALTTPVSMAVMGAGWPDIVVGVLLGMVILERHQDNLRRLRAGAEPRFTGRRVSPPQ
jgi:glycerol-3-phosphate acyltransferase PlsY